MGERVAAGARLGSYELVEPLGKGGMGEVWRARHVTLGRSAAVKVVRPEALLLTSKETGPSLLQRFEREARATAQLSSPHTIALYDFGQGPDGTFFYAMELLNGIDLESLVNRFGPIEPARAVRLLTQACDSLAEAHERGLIHRDVKPANVFTCRQGLMSDFVKVLDFGLVKPVPIDGQSQTDLTATQVATGTPAYMAPEVALGQTPLDGRVDIYGLGCLAYWLLSGAHVFVAATAMRMVLDHVQAPPPALSPRTKGGVPAELEALIMSCLAKSPDLRPAGAAALKGALLACPVGDPWGDERADRWWQANLPDLWARSTRASAPPASPKATPAEPPAATPQAPAAAPALAPSVFAPEARPTREPPRLTHAQAAEISETRLEVLRQLRYNFAHSTIDLDEYERRAEEATYAGTPAALQSVVADLPVLDTLGHLQVVANRPAEGAMVRYVPEPLAVRRDQPPAVPARRGDRVLAVLGGASRGGAWQPAQHVQVIAFLGGVTLDFRDAVLRPGVTEVSITAVFGGVDIVVPPDVACTSEGSGILGGWDSRGCKGPSGDPNETRLVFKGTAVMGGVDIKAKPRRSDR